MFVALLVLVAGLSVAGITKFITLPRAVGPDDVAPAEVRRQTCGHTLKDSTDGRSNFPLREHWGDPRSLCLFRRQLVAVPVAH